ncbi:MAG: tetratricopeptide repeat protein [Myxococcales bacterium]
MRTSAALVVACGLSIAAPSLSARAAPGAAAARERFRAAQEAYHEGRFDEALKLYQAAYDLRPVPGLLFDIAQCHRQLGHLDQALFLYRRLLAHPPRTVDLEMVRRLIGQTEQAKRDAAERARLEKEIELERARTATARAEAAKGSTTSAAGADRLLILPTVVEREPAVAAATAPPPRPVYRRGWFWAAFGGAFAVTSVVGWVEVAEFNSYVDGARTRGTTDTGLTASQKQQTAQIWQGVAVGTAVATALAAGLAAWTW